MTGPGRSPDGSFAAFHEHRSLLFGIAYRMLGSAADAEDVLQDAFLRWQGVRASKVRSARDYLCTMVTRLAVDSLRSARVRRLRYVGQWLPEPLVGVDVHDPLAATTMAESLSTAFLVLLERLTPQQRAAFILREAFAFEFREVARILGTTAANARQIVKRARRQLEDGSPRFVPDKDRASELAHRFLMACSTGAIDELISLLDESIVALADGGGGVSAARHPIVGAHRVARLVSGLARKWRASGNLHVEPVNGSLGITFRASNQLRAVLTLAHEPRTGRISRVFIVVNPDKLSRRGLPTSSSADDGR